jgi:hypothetical protein
MLMHQDFFPRGNRRRPTETVARTAALKGPLNSFKGDVMKRMMLLTCILALSIAALTTGLHAQPKVKFKFTNISVPGAAETDAYAINNKNEIAGDYINAAGVQAGMFLKGTKVTSVSCSNGEPAVIFGVNAAGTGVADCGGNDPGAPGPEDGYVIYQVQNGHIVIVPISCDCPWIVSYAINDINMVVGSYQNSNGNVLGFSYDLNTSTFTTLEVPNTINTAATGINNAGLITLQATDPASGLVQSYLFNGSSYTSINVAGAQQSWVHGINNNGDIVYTVEDSNGFDWGVFFYATLQEIYWFNQPEGRDNTRAYGINDEVVGKASSKLKLVGEYTSPASGQNFAYEATVTIKP